MDAIPTTNERIARIQAQEEAKWRARRWHAELMGEHVAYVYDPKGNIAAVLDDTSADVKRDRLTLLRQAVAMAAAGEALDVEAKDQDRPAERIRINENAEVWRNRHPGRYQGWWGYETQHRPGDWYFGDFLPTQEEAIAAARKATGGH